MNKKLMALAVAGALTAPAAALAQVQIYGRANVGLNTYSATGATAGRLESVTLRSPPLATAQTRWSRLTVLASRCAISSCMT